MKKEIPYIHIVRVLACMMVVCLHSLPAFQTTGIDYYFRTGVVMFTRPCVPLFLMISGVLLLPYTGTDVSVFYKKRILRVLCPLLFWGVVYSVLPYLIGVESVASLFSNLLYLLIDYPHEIGGILWYLYVLIGLYLVIPFINPAVFTNSKHQVIYIILWFAASFVGLIRCYHSQVLGMTPFCDSYLLFYFSGYLGYLFLGKYLHISKNGVGGGKNIILIIIYLFSIVVIYSLNDVENYKYMGYFLSFPAIIMSTVLFVLVKNFPVRTDVFYYKVLKNISTLSFGIYLSHMVIYRTLTAHIYSYSTHPMAQLLVMGLTLGGAYLLALIISKFPYI